MSKLKLSHCRLLPTALLLLLLFLCPLRRVVMPDLFPFLEDPLRGVRFVTLASTLVRGHLPKPSRLRPRQSELLEPPYQLFHLAVSPSIRFPPLLGSIPPDSIASLPTPSPKYTISSTRSRCRSRSRALGLPVRRTKPTPSGGTIEKRDVSLSGVYPLSDVDRFRNRVRQGGGVYGQQDGRRWKQWNRLYSTFHRESSVSSLIELLRTFHRINLFMVISRVFFASDVDSSSPPLRFFRYSFLLAEGSGISSSSDIIQLQAISL
jgi:hypothetical protein